MHQHNCHYRLHDGQFGIGTTDHFGGGQMQQARAGFVDEQPPPGLILDADRVGQMCQNDIPLPALLTPLPARDAGVHGPLAM